MVGQLLSRTQVSRNSCSYFIYGLAVFFIVACSNDAKEKEEIQKLQEELKEAKAMIELQSNEIAELRNTPEQRFIRAEKNMAKEQISEAKNEYQGIIESFEGTNHAEIAKAEIAKIEKTIAEKTAEEERKKALGWKILSPTNNAGYDGLKVKFERVWTGKRWAFDDHGREYFLRDATRGNTHVLARVSITAEGQNPALPPVLVYQMKEGALHYKGTLQYEFRRWKDYGTYLGNTADYGNDFAHSGTIPFNLGYEIDEVELKNNPTYVVMKKNGCFYRIRNDYGNPEVAYRETGCSEKKILTLEDFEKDYVLIKQL